MKKWHLQVGIILCFVALILIVVLQNLQPLQFRIFFWEFELAKSVGFFGAFALGVLTSMVFCLIWRRGGRKEAPKKISADT